MTARRAQPSFWRIHGVRVTGYRHEREGTPCQDFYAWGATDGGRIAVLAVADGAGSRRSSEKGSKLASELAVRFFTDRFSRGGPPDPKEELRSCLNAVHAEFLRQTGAAADDHATTLTVMVLASGWAGYASVGDGFAVVRSGAHRGRRLHHLMPQPQPVSEYSNEVAFLTSPGALDQACVEVLRDAEITGVLLSTDGLAQAALVRPPRRRANDSFVSAMFRELDNPQADLAEDERKLKGYLSSERMVKLNGDDKTVLRAVRL